MVRLERTRRGCFCERMVWLDWMVGLVRTIRSFWTEWDIRLVGMDWVVRLVRSERTQWLVWMVRLVRLLWTIWTERIL